MLPILEILFAERTRCLALVSLESCIPSAIPHRPTLLFDAATAVRHADNIAHVKTARSMAEGLMTPPS
jgi:hypothetical protein